MTPFDRGLLMIITGWWQQPLYFLWQGPYVYNEQLYLALIFAVLLLMGLRLFWVSLTRRNNAGGKAVVHDYKLGQVRISVLAIENLVKKAVGQLPGVKEVKPRVVEHQKGMGLHIRVVVTPDISIPEVSREIQQKVQEYLAQTTGITVSEIKVIVDNISSTRPRVE